MNLKQHQKRDDLKVWLSENEVDQLLEIAKDTEQRIAFALGSRCGLRSHEVLDVSPEDVSQTDAGPMLRVWEGKGDKMRETPVPNQLQTQIETAADMRDADDDEPLLSISSTRSLRHWVQNAREQLRAETGKDEWRYLSYHDLRRTWATSLASEDVDPLVVCDWGGWNDLDTFLEHYRGTFSPEAQLREREKVTWL